jgi:hypothetical protein
VKLISKTLQIIDEVSFVPYDDPNMHGTKEILKTKERVYRVQKSTLHKKVGKR